MDEISEYLLFTGTEGGYFGFRALPNSTHLFYRGVGAYFFINTLNYLEHYCQTLLTKGWSRNHEFGPY